MSRMKDANVTESRPSRVMSPVNEIYRAVSVTVFIKYASEIGWFEPLQRVLIVKRNLDLFAYGNKICY